MVRSQDCTRTAPPENVMRPIEICRRTGHQTPWQNKLAVLDVNGWTLIAYLARFGQSERSGIPIVALGIGICLPQSPDN